MTIMRSSAKVFLTFAVLIALSEVAVFANSNSSDILKQGLLGAGSGAVGGAASGARGGDLWKGALAGAGVNIVGGALLDSISGQKVEDTRTVDNMNSQTAYSEGYQAGYANSYKAGYTEGYRDGLQETHEAY
jgi:hypothetical protein